MCKLIKDELILLSEDVKQEVLDKLTPEYLSELRNTYSNMNLVENKSEDVITLTFKKTKLKLKPANITYSNIFGDPLNEEPNIAYLFL